MPRRTMHVGLISDTHGLLRESAVAALRGCDFIVHAGDIGDPAILDRLTRIAPVTAVRGNNDHGAWAVRLGDTASLHAGGIAIHVLHDLAELAVDPAAAGIRVVVCGHSHKPAIAERDGVVYVNPGSAGPRRFSLPVSVGHVVIEGDSIRPRLETIDASGPAAT